MNKTHPQSAHIHGMELYMLNNLRPIVKSAIDSWSENSYNKSKEVCDFNVKYFTDELELIDFELKKHGVSI